MKKYSKIDWEINMFQDKFPEGCDMNCFCSHPAEDCGCVGCQKRHAYTTYYSPVLRKIQDYRLN